MKITLDGSLMPLAVKFSGGSRKRARTDFDAPPNGKFKSFFRVHFIDIAYFKILTVIIRILLHLTVRKRKQMENGIK